MKDRYVFLRTAERDGEIVALIGDSSILGDAGVRSLRLAFAAHATPVTRSGVMIYTLQHLQERLPVLEQNKMHESAAAFRHAIECVEKRIGKSPGPEGPAPHKIEGPVREQDPARRQPEPPPHSGTRPHKNAR